MLCLTSSKNTINEVVKEVNQYRKNIDLVELRIDLLKEEEKLKAQEFPALIDLPVILTYRRKSDGGAYTGSEKSRLKLFKSLALSYKFAYVDIEEDVKTSTFDKELREKGVRIIRSYHDFEDNQKDLISKINRIANKGDIPKIAIMTRNIFDVYQIFLAAEQLEHIKEKIIVGMSQAGIPTRLLYKKIGSLLMYCSSDEKINDLGHLNARIMDELYRVREVNENTKIYGIIGDPVMHSLSPSIHNPGFKQIRFNAIYIPFLVDNINIFFKLAERIKIFGFSVTVPHKRSVIPFLGLINREVKLIGSCNTVIRSRNQWKGINTDYYGFLDPLKEDLDNQKIKKVLIIGAGGAARAVVWALKSYNCKLIIVNRNEEKAKALANETMSSYDKLSRASSYADVDMIVQTTSVGMMPNIKETPLKDYNFKENQIVYDLVYTPKLTTFLLDAKSKGCKLIYGWDMLYKQGKLQFEAFTGYHYPKSAEIFV